MRVRPNTGGLRLLTTEATLLTPSSSFSRPPEAGLFRFGKLEKDSSLELRFPYSTEQDVATISVKLDIIYVTADGTYTLSLMPSVPVSLDLGVNVQDVFKHAAIFSRFSVSTASPGPLVLHESSLIESEVFDAEFGFESSRPVTIFPKQPASLLYKITRKPDVAIGSKTQKTLYLKLQYTVVLDTIIAQATSSLKEASTGTQVARFTSVLAEYTKQQLSSKLSPYDLERAALLSEVSTSSLVGPELDAAFHGLGKISGADTEAAAGLAEFVRSWQKAHSKMELLDPNGIEGTRSILIPVDIPSMPILYTVDIQIDQPLPSSTYGSDENIVDVNQLLSANLKIQWTRGWNTLTATDLTHDFAYEVTAPPDTWLIGGQRRGHISTSASAGPSPASSSTLNIPLMLVPLREGWLPYPSVEIREARADSEGATGAQGHCETDYRNLGETVRVVSDRNKVTLNLDSSGPGGGPLVLESQGRSLEGRVVV